MAVALLEHKTLGEHFRPVQDAARLRVQHEHDHDHAFVPEDAAFPQHGRTDIPHALAVHQRAFHGQRRLQPEAVGQQRNGMPVFQHHHIFTGHAFFHGQPPVLDKVAVFPVHRHENVGIDRMQHLHQFLAVRMPRGMDGAHAFIQHFRAQPVHFINQTRNGLGIAGDHPGAHDDRIALAHAQLTMSAVDHPGQSRQGLALRSRHNQHKLLVGQIRHPVVRIEEIGRQLGNAQIAGHLDIVGQRFAADDHGTPMFLRQIKDFLNALNMA